MTSKIYRYLLLFLLVVSSCQYDDITNNIDTNINESYLRIQVSVPDLNTQRLGRSTRAMNDVAERAIDVNKLNVLVFKVDKDDNAKETFAYKASIKGDVVYDQSNPNNATITATLLRDKTNQEYRFVIIANHDIDASSLEGKTKQEVLGSLIFDATGKWSATTDIYTPFPMWGESNAVEMTSNMSLDVIELYRALSRIDVGTNFELEDGKYSDVGQNLDNFKIKEVNVYRTYDEGTVAPLKGNKIASIPSSADRNNDDSPLEYSQDVAAFQFVREIYVPESNLEDTPNKDNVHTIVVGAHYREQENISYYRLDFATETKEGGRVYMPILRNHRYIFNITKVRGSGFATAEEALESTSTIIEYEVIDWDESFTKVEVEGKYYFGVDQSLISFSATPADEENGLPEEVFEVKYKTNYPITDADAVTYTLVNGKEGEYFSVDHDNINNTFTIKSLKENIENRIVRDTLLISAGPFNVPVPIQQSYVNYNYYIDCDKVVVSGTYMNGTVLDGNKHFITVTINAEEIETLTGRKYELEASVVGDPNGIKFKGSGTFGTEPEIEVVLKGSGTVSSSGDPIMLRITSNSSSNSSCEVAINTVFKKMRVLAFGLDNYFGYNITGNYRNSAKVLLHKNNFGAEDYSTVKVEGIELINGGTIPSESLVREHLETNPVDIVYLTFGTVLYEYNHKILAKYIKNGGVALLFEQESQGANGLFSLVYDKEITSNNQGPAGSVYKLYGNPYGDDIYINDPDFKDPFQNDPILVGPFGDLRGKYWGEDASITLNLYAKDFNMDDIVIYSRRDNNDLGTFNAYRDKIFNLIFFGDGGLSSSSGFLNGDLSTSNIAAPFWYDKATMKPIPDPSYSKVVYNSQLWSNIWAWAIETAATNGINSNNN